LATRVRSGTWRLVWESYKQVGAVPGVLFLLSFFLWLSPRSSVRWGVVAPVLCFLLLLVATLVNAIWISRGRSEYVSPSAVRAMVQQLDGEEVTVCLLEESPFLRRGSIVTLFRKERDFERLMALGRIDHVQEDGLLQAFLYKIYDGQEDAVKALATNNKDALEAVVVVPGGNPDDAGFAV